MTFEYVDMAKAGIIDPAKVERCALQNAASVAAMFLTTEALVVDVPEDKKAPAMPMQALAAWVISKELEICTEYNMEGVDYIHPFHVL